MTGQDAVNSAKAFNDALELDGVIMTKLDGDARGGAALSVKHVTGVPIKFIGIGEHLDALEEFHPGTDGRPHPGHGRHPHAGRAGAAEVRPGRDADSGRADAQGRVHARRLPQACSSMTKKPGPLEQGDGHDPRHGADEGDDGRTRTWKPT